MTKKWSIEALENLREARGAVMDKIRDHRAGATTAEETAQIGYAGISVAHLTSVEYEILGRK